MKIRFLLLTMAAALMAGCTDELDRGDVYKLEKGISATIPAYPFDGGTRVNISNDLQSFTWSDGDELGLYYQGSNSTAHAAFSIISGGGSTGNFENEAFILKKSSTYYAFYPFNEKATIASAPVDFTGQVQNGNGSAAHLGGYNYMYSTLNTDDSGNASIQFKNLGSVIQLRLTVSHSAIYTDVDIKSGGTKFITKGTASMTDGSVTATETSASIHLDFENGIALSAHDVLIANILVAPVDMSGSALTITLTDEGGNTYYTTTAGKNMLQGKAYLYEERLADDSNIPYITFTADAEQTFRFASYVGYVEPTEIDTLIANLEYSINNQDWVTMSGPSTIVFGGTNGKLRIRGKNPNGTSEGIDFNNDPYSKISFGNGTPVSCSGDIRTIVDFENYASVSTDNSRFIRLFSGCSQLTSAPELPATTLADRCYKGLFANCTSLTQAPELQATTLAGYCYSDMFENCTSLTQAPELPATTLAEFCYSHMFSGCTSLTQAPELPATTLAEWCFSGMFQGCTSLTQAPELPATTLAKLCYAGMFSGCTSLTQAPELPATTLTKGCYQYMFSNCTSLTQAPELPATTLAEWCYQYMFSDCTSLTQAPELPATTLAGYCYLDMFSGCTSLTQAPELPATTLAKSCYYYMFSGCTSLTQAPELPATTLAQSCYSHMFYGTNVLPNCENIDFTSETVVASGGLMGLFSGTKVNYSDLTRILPKDTNNKPCLPVTTLAEKCYRSMFSGCTSLTQAPELPATTLAQQCYYRMFQGCTSLNQAPELPATTLADFCYEGMFFGCTSLTQAPELPATTLAEYCYQYMFYGCSNLNYIKMMATDISASSCLNAWVEGVSSTGTFVKNSAATWNVIGKDGIPSGWSVVKE